MSSQLATLKERSATPEDWDDASQSLGQIKTLVAALPAATPSSGDGDYRIALGRSIDFLATTVEAKTSTGQPTALTPILFGALLGASAKSLKAVQNGYVDVTVRTYGEGKTEVNGLRVFFVSDTSHDYGCDRQNRASFDSLSFEAKVKLPTAKWWIWAEDGNGRRTEVMPLPLIADDQGARIIDLPVSWQGN